MLSAGKSQGPWSGSTYVLWGLRPDKKIVGVLLLGFSVTRGKKYRLLFHNGSFKEKSINVWYSKAQFRYSKDHGTLESRAVHAVAYTWKLF